MCLNLTNPKSTPLAPPPPKKNRPLWQIIWGQIPSFLEISPPLQNFNFLVISPSVFTPYFDDFSFQIQKNPYLRKMSKIHEKWEPKREKSTKIGTKTAKNPGNCAKIHYKS